MAKIGVIVPLYNAEKYLCKCIDSILKQTFQDFELILIDDGSTDKSSEICEQYARKNKNILVIHMEHGGVSAARNRGLEENTNEYIVFVDADDFIEPHFLEILYSAAQEKKADIVLTEAFIWVKTGKRRIRQCTYHSEEILKQAAVITKEETYRRVLLGINTIALWEKLYHRSIFQSVRFPVGKIHEDGKVFVQLIESANRIAYVPSYAGYFYQIRRGSITHNVMSAGEYESIKNAEALVSFIKRNYPGIEYAARRYYACCCLRLINLMIFAPEYADECRLMRKKLLKMKKDILFSRHTTIYEKGSVICLLFGTAFYPSALRILTYISESGRVGLQIHSCK